MAINWTEIEGYDETMSAEDKLVLLETQKPKEPVAEPPTSPPATPPATPAEPMVEKQGTKTVPKTQLDKALSEVAAVKKQLRAKMSEDEQKEAERLESEEATKQELATLRREKTLSGHKAAFLGLGYDDALAESTATALADGDMDSVFASMKKQTVNMEKTLRSQILKETPVPPAGADPNADKLDLFTQTFKEG